MEGPRLSVRRREALKEQGQFATHQQIGRPACKKSNSRQIQWGEFGGAAFHKLDTRPRLDHRFLGKFISRVNPHRPKSHRHHKVPVHLRRLQPTGTSRSACCPVNRNGNLLL